MTPQRSSLRDGHGYYRNQLLLNKANERHVTDVITGIMILVRVMYGQGYGRGSG